MTRNGIDVSKHQGVIDWSKVKASGKVDFAVIRAGYGKVISQKDPQFEANYKGCTENGIPCGAYWYSYAMSAEEAVKEAETCLSAIKGKQFAYPIYFDFEEKKQIALGRTAVSGIVRAFCETLEKAGYVAGIYSMKSGLESCLTADVRSAYTNWVAHVGVTKTSYSGHDMWQYSWKGSIPGISGDVDFNYCYRDFPAEIAAAGKNGYTANAPSEPAAKSIDELAHEVMDGKWGNGEDRRQRLTAAGYDYGAVQAAVDALMKATSVRTHTVRKGDTLSAIAKKYGTTVSAIVTANREKYPKITADYIVVGWVLAV